MPLSEIVKKGRKPKRSAELEEREKHHLTAERTATIASAVAALNTDGVDVKKTTVWRTAKFAKVSYKRTINKPREVLTEQIIEQRSPTRRSSAR